MGMTAITKVPFELGEPQVAGALAVFPVLGTDAQTAFTGLPQGLRAGAFVKEVDEHGSVGSVRVVNPNGQALLIYEGEEIEGARQNRCFAEHTLVPAGAELMVSVSCVERGRWDEKARSARFRSAPHAPDPELRALRRTHDNRAAREHSPRRGSQQLVWKTVSERLSTHEVASSSDSLADVFRAKQPGLDELRSHVRHVPGQVGAVIQISGRPAGLDLAGRAEVFADLLPRLTAGYALQALDADGGDANERSACGFLFSALEAHRQPLPTAGMGDGFAISQAGLDGSGLLVGVELIALSAFPTPGRFGAR
jgi:hypothetical protein